MARVVSLHLDAFDQYSVVRAALKKVAAPAGSSKTVQ
jgi:hypothetical protein